MTKVETGLVIFDYSGPDLMKKHSFQSNFSVATVCDKSLQNTSFRDRIRGKRPEKSKQVTILSMTKLHTELVILYDSGSDLMKKHSFQSNFNVTTFCAKTLQNTAF